MLEGEEKLIERAKKGDNYAFVQLYNHYVAPIYRFVFIKINHKAITEDLTQEVFLSAFENLKNYSFQGCPLSSWLYQIARNKVIDYYRTKRNNLSIEGISEDVLKVIDAKERDLNLDFDLRRVREATLKLSETEQDVIIMRFIEDLSYSEIASAINKSEGAVRLIQHRAIKNLKKVLEDKKKDERRKIN
jgi:RNA polymerase sigma-70 factor (ECF subfamily)